MTHAEERGEKRGGGEEETIAKPETNETKNFEEGSEKNIAEEKPDVVSNLADGECTNYGVEKASNQRRRFDSSLTTTIRSEAKPIRCSLCNSNFEKLNELIFHQKTHKKMISSQVSRL